MDRSAQGSDQIEMAIWFHDCIYEPLARDNEAKSAEHFRKQLGPYLDEALVGRVERLILATDPGKPRSGQADEGAGLGSATGDGAGVEIDRSIMKNRLSGVATDGE